jgi:hypothetical protein
LFHVYIHIVVCFIHLFNKKQAKTKNKTKRKKEKSNKQIITIKRKTNAEKGVHID